MCQEYITVRVSLIRGFVESLRGFKIIWSRSKDDLQDRGIIEHVSFV